MAEISPGYDFGVNETVTKDKLLRAARGLTLGDISDDVINANFLTVLTGNDTAASGGSPDQVGQLWIAPSGDIWMRGNRGNVKLKRYQGGWETNRYNFQTTAGTQPGAGLRCNANGSYADPGVAISPTRYDTGQGIDVALLAETGFSGAVRITGRGLCTYGFEAGHGVSSGGFWNNLQMLRVNGPSPSHHWQSENIDTFDRRFFVGPILGLHPASTGPSGVSLAPTVEVRIDRFCHGYFLGARILGPGGTP